MKAIWIVLIIVGIILLIGLVIFIIYFATKSKTCTQPNAPTNVSASIQDTLLKVSWNAVANVSGYYIYLLPTANANINNSMETFTLIGADNNQFMETLTNYPNIEQGVYYVKVSTFNRDRNNNKICMSGGEPTQGIRIEYNKGCTTPIAPKNISATINGSILTVNWTPSQNNVYGYYVFLLPTPTATVNNTLAPFSIEGGTSSTVTINLKNYSHISLGTYYIKVGAYSLSGTTICPSVLVPTEGIPINYT